MSETADLAAWVVWGGFGLALILGFVAAKTNFCTMGAISDVVNMEHWGRMRMWLLAIAVAMPAPTCSTTSTWSTLTKSIYQRPSLPWLSLLLGGTLFGIGMTIAGGCANKNLLRVGGGSLRSLVVLVFVAISAYMTLKGLFGQWRSSLSRPGGDRSRRLRHGNPESRRRAGAGCHRPARQDGVCSSPWVSWFSAC